VRRASHVVCRRQGYHLSERAACNARANRDSSGCTIHHPPRRHETRWPHGGWASLVHIGVSIDGELTLGSKIRIKPEITGSATTPIESEGERKRADEHQ
jgi:hypothetical protein